ncbi:hypothetical protein DsansV1_C11g0112071 [Dioscorea sansibarensis]
MEGGGGIPPPLVGFAEAYTGSAIEKDGEGGGWRGKQRVTDWRWTLATEQV